MRRKDRELTQKEDILRILEANQVCRLGLADGEQPYVLPLNFGYSWPENEPLTLYFHCAKQGRKLDILAKNDSACFELDSGHQLIDGPRPCDYSYHYESVIGFGRATILTDAAEKSLGLQKIMERQAGPGSYSFSEADLAGVVVFCLRAEQVTGKSNLPT